MKTGRRTAALRRGIAFLCTLVLTLMAVTLPAKGANVEGKLGDSNIGLSHNDYQPGNKPTLNARVEKSGYSSSLFWKAYNNTSIEGELKPQEYTGVKSKKTYSCCESGASSTLFITNQSTEKMLLTFSFTVPSTGTLSIDGTIYENNSTYSGELDPQQSISVVMTTEKNPQMCGLFDSNQSKYVVTTRLSNIKLESPHRDVKVNLVPTTHGSYTAKVGGTPLDVGKTHQYPAETEYTFISGAADTNYTFGGWYNGDGSLLSLQPTFTTFFTEDCTVTARFVEEPLFSIFQLADVAGGEKSQYIEVKSDYYHNEKDKRGSYHTNVGDQTVNNSYGPPTYFPDSRWSAVNGTIQSSAKGIATGDYQNEPGYSQARAQLYSDIIRVKCLENCIISFDSSMAAKSVNIKNSGSNDDQYGVFLYCYTTSSANANANTIKANGTVVIKGSQKTNGSAKGTKVVVNKEEYLYLYAYAWTRNDSVFLGVLDKGYAIDNYEYLATISNVTVTPNNEKCTFKTQNTDNMGNALAGGTVLINGVHQSVSKPYTAEPAKGTTLTLKPGNAPTGYTFIGWYNAISKTYDYTHNSITVTMTEDCEINPIYVPAMTITTGGTNGYGDAKYEYKNLSNQTEPHNGQYVARGPIPDSGDPKFYTDLKTAFANESTVFLLAGDIINGDLTIPKGKTLVIPDRFAAKGPDLQTGLPEQYDPSASISSYCKVSYSGNLTVEGTLVVNARQSGAAGGVCGRATGGIGYLSLSDGSTVTVKSGGSLFGYGLIRGGSISAESNSTVRELMEISDMRAALVMKEIYSGKTDYKVFPFSNFSIKSIESRATYQADAKLYAQYSVTLEGNNKSQGAVPLFATSGALFNLTNGSMTKYFDPATYKTVYRVDENSTMDTGFFQLSVKFAVAEQKTELTIDTKEYWMPLNAGFDLRTAGDMTVNGDFKFLPGASLSVEKGGKCIVANGVNLLFYRLNDYDTRGIVQGIYQKGYSSKPYPVNATRLLPDDPLAPKDPSKIGSARLNVDGKMIVKGGLYVSNELVRDSEQGFDRKEPVDDGEKTRKEINTAYFKPPYPYANGYNVLTGTGSIDMTAAQTKQPEVYEAMTSQNTNDPAWAPIPISPIKGLAENAQADDSNNYQPLNTQAIYYGVYRPGGFYIWTTVKPQIAKIINGSSETTYRSLAAAVAAYDGTNGYIQMIENSTEPGFTVDRDVTLDLNGKTVTLASPLTVAEGKTLYGMDSSAKVDYVTAPKGKIVGTVKGCAPTYQTPGDTNDCYVAIQGTEENGTSNLSFHRFNISVTGYRFELAAPQCALFFIGEFQGDAEAKNHLTKLGFTLKDKKGNQLGEANYEFTAGTVFPPMPNEGEASDSKVVCSGDAYLFEAYLMRSFKKDKPNDYTEQIDATAQATFNNGGTQDSEPKQWSFKDAWTETDGLKDLTPKQQEILNKFLTDLGILNP